MRKPFTAILLLAGCALSLRAQSVRLQVSSGTVTILGTSNIHDWKCSSATSPMILVPSATGPELGRNITSITLSIPVKSLDCGNGQMTSNLAKALHADAHPTINFQLASYTARPAGAGYQATATGSLTINGVTRKVTLNGTARPDGKGALRAEASTKLNTNDFGVEPVKAMLGSIKTGEMVTIQAVITGSAPLAAAAVAAAAIPPAAVKAPARTPVPAKEPVTTAPTPGKVAATKPSVVPSKPVPAATRPATTVPATSASTATVPTRVVVDSVVVPVVTTPVPVPVVVTDTIVAITGGEVVVIADADTAAAPTTVAGPTESPADSTRRFALPPLRIQHMRPRDQRGLLIFESPKEDTVSYNGFTLQWGAAFAQGMQELHHSNTATPVVVGGVNQNELMAIGGGFNNAVANLYLDAQLARGIRVAMTSYLSSRHHSETWVKDGYFLIDASPIEHPLLDLLMNFATIKVGHFEVNYGDAHFRRTDNGQAMHNPLIGNLILDGFTTEIGGEGMLRVGPLLAMAGVTGGEIRGQVTGPSQRSPAWLAKLGFDRQVAPDLRVRLTGSTYGSAKSRSNTLYTGDRGGSPYFMVLENTTATEAAAAWSGNIRPGFANVVHAYMMNPFVKFRALEFFGTIETSTGKANAEARKRTVRQLAGEGVIHFGRNDRLFGAARYNRVAGELAGMPNDISTDRWQVGGGWFVLPTVLAKAEYVRQRYYQFPANDIRNGGRFSGFVLAGALAF